MQTVALPHAAGPRQLPLGPRLPLTRAGILSGCTAHAAARPAMASASLQRLGSQWPVRLCPHAPSFPPHSLARSRRCRATKPGEESPPSGPEAGPGSAAKGEEGGEGGESGAVAAASSFLGRAAQSPLWLLFLFVTLVATFGGYGYLIATNVEESNVPILVGPRGPQQQAQAQAPSAQQ